MAIEKESSGLPEVDVHRPTTKVNFAIIAGVILFLALMIGLVVRYAARADVETNRPAPAPQDGTAAGTPASPETPKKE